MSEEIKDEKLVESKRVMVELPSSLHTAFKLKCIQQQTTMSEQIETWIRAYVEGKKVKGMKNGWGK